MTPRDVLGILAATFIVAIVLGAIDHLLGTGVAIAVGVCLMVAAPVLLVGVKDTLRIVRREGL